MGLRDGSAAFSLNRHDAPAAASSQSEEAAWRPARNTQSPALELQAELHASFSVGHGLPEITVPPAEQALRLVSRAAGYAALVGAVGLIISLFF